LIISENTVKTHVSNILEKLGIQSRRQVAAYVRHLDRRP
jgi:DNA-binding NarL/FixJ family response regulator